MFRPQCLYGIAQLGQVSRCNGRSPPSLQDDRMTVQRLDPEVGVGVDERGLTINLSTTIGCTDLLDGQSQWVLARRCLVGRHWAAVMMMKARARRQ